jgi:hypothetical protein
MVGHNASVFADRPLGRHPIGKRSLGMPVKIWGLLVAGFLFVWVLPEDKNMTGKYGTAQNSRKRLGGGMMMLHTLLVVWQRDAKNLSEQKQQQNTCK